MYALKRVTTDDNVGNTGPILEDEHCILATSVGVGVAWLTAIKFLVTEVLAAGDDGGRGKTDSGSCAGGDVESPCRSKTGDEGRKLNFVELHCEEFQDASV